MRKIFLMSFIIFSLFMVPAVEAAFGVSTPAPPSLELMKGESGRFKFQLQVSPDEAEPRICTAGLSNISQLIVEFDDYGPYEVIPGGRAVVLGTVTAPETIDFGTHTEQFCVSCRPASVPEGAAVVGVYCTPEINVEVVPTRTRENMFIPPKPEPETNIMLVIGLIAAVAVIIALIIIILILLKRKKKKQGHHAKKK